VERTALVVAPEQLAHAREVVGERPDLLVVPGGSRRRDSVCNGLIALGPCVWVAVHDAARPCATRALLVRTWEAARVSGAAVAAVPVRDTIKRVAAGVVAETLPRDELWAVQTPQVFRGDLLAAAHRACPDDVTDDAALVERLGIPVRIAEGSYANIKVTMPGDLALAVWLRDRGHD